MKFSGTRKEAKIENPSRKHQCRCCNCPDERCGRGLGTCVSQGLIREGKPPWVVENKELIITIWLYAHVGIGEAVSIRQCCCIWCWPWSEHSKEWGSEDVKWGRTRTDWNLRGWTGVCLSHYLQVFTCNSGGDVQGEVGVPWQGATRKFQGSWRKFWECRRLGAHYQPCAKKMRQEVITSLQFLHLLSINVASAPLLPLKSCQNVSWVQCEPKNHADEILKNVFPAKLSWQPIKLPHNLMCGS